MNKRPKKTKRGNQPRIAGVPRTIWLPFHLWKKIEKMATSERRALTRQVEQLLSTHPAIQS